MSRLNLDYFEKIILYFSLTDPSYLTTIVDFLKPEYFKTPGISSIFEIIKNFYDKRQELPTNTEIKSYLVNDSMKKSFKDLVISFKDIDKNLNNTELYENTEKFLKERAIYHTLLEIAEDVVKGNVDTSIALAKFETACGINLITDLGLEIYDDVEKVVEELLKTNRVIPSLWEWFDDKIGGGFQENGRALYMFAGESNIGKSIILGNVAANIAEQGKNVLVVTLEMSEALYAERIISNITKIPIKLLAADIPTLRHSMRQRKKETGGKIYIKEFPPSTITPNQLKGFIKKMVDSGVKLDAIIIDYLNLLHSTSRDNSYERIKDISEQVRAMTYAFNCPIVSATQLNRDGFNTDNPNMVTISESIGLAATSDVIASIFQSEEDREMGIIRLGMMKNRLGIRGGTQAMRIDYNTLSIIQADDIDELEEDEALRNLMGIVDN